MLRREGYMNMLYLRLRSHKIFFGFSLGSHVGAQALLYYEVLWIVKLQTISRHIRFLTRTVLCSQSLNNQLMEGELDQMRKQARCRMQQTRCHNQLIR